MRVSVMCLSGINTGKQEILIPVAEHAVVLMVVLLEGGGLVKYRATPYSHGASGMRLECFNRTTRFGSRRRLVCTDHRP